MDKWEAKYKAVVCGITDPKIVQCADLMVKLAYKMSSMSGLPFHGCLAAITETAVALQRKPVDIDELNKKMLEL